jgi:hypothetical protein
MDIARDRKTALQTAVWAVALVIFVGGLAWLTRKPPGMHIQILRETLFEQGLGVDPHGIALTHDGGLVVAGSLYGRAWATLINPTGTVAWRYLFPNSSYVGAVQLPDDSTLLCGVNEDFSSQRGLLTHISATGTVIGREMLPPQEDSSFARGDIRFCEPYGSGAVAVGIDFSTADDQTRGAPSFHISFVDARGTRTGDHFVVMPGILLDVFSDEQDVILLLDGVTRDAKGKNVTATHLVRVDQSGAIKGDRVVVGGGFYLHPVPRQTATISLFLEPDGKSRLKRLGPSFEDVSEINGPDANFFPTRSFVSGDGSIVSCGYSQYRNENSYSASITWVSSSLRERQVLMFSPIFTSFRVGAAMPSGREGEFIAVRGAYPRGVPASEKDPTGLMVTVFKIH